MEVCRKSPAIIVQNQVHFQCQDLPLLQHHSGLNRRGHSWDPCRPACSSHWELFHWTTEPPWGRFQLKNSSWWWLRDIWIYLANIRALDGNYFVAFLLQQGYCLSDCPLTARSRLKKAIPVDSYNRKRSKHCYFQEENSWEMYSPCVKSNCRFCLVTVLIPL